MHNVYDPETTKSLLSLSNITRTRSHPLKLSKKSTNTLKYQKFFTNRIINNWNNLPSDIIMSDSVNSFKNKIDHYFKDLMYSTNLEV